MNFSYEHTKEVFQEAMEIADENWDCTLIKKAKQNKAITVNPIYEWTDRDIWRYIIDEEVEVNPLYREKGLDRIGCCGCPMAGKHREEHFRLCPTYEMAYRNTCKKIIEKRKAEGTYTEKLQRLWPNADAMFDWWMERDEMEGQMTLQDGTTIWTEPSTVRRETCPYILRQTGQCLKTQDPCEDVPDVHCEFAKERGNGNE